jgi:hypothetical protein
VAAIAVVVTGLAALAATTLRISRAGGSALSPALVVVVMVLAARVLVTIIVRRARRKIRLPRPGRLASG